MSELLAFVILVLLFTVRFVVPLLVIVGFGRLLNHIYAGWEVDGKVAPKYR